jgi:hemoglobin
LGGYDAVAAVTDELIARLAADKQLGRFLVGISDDSKGKLRQHFVEFLCFSAGGPCVYTARDM